MTSFVMEGELTSLDESAFEAFIAERQRLGHDRHDEVWDGVYHVAPLAHPRHGRLETEIALALAPRAKAAGLIWSGGFNLGEPHNYRGPDAGAYRELTDEVYLATATIVVEVLSPRDETFKKFDFYFGRGVEEFFVVDPLTKRCRVWLRGDDAFVEADASALLEVSMSRLDVEITWS